MYILRNAFLEKSQQIIIVLIRSQELDTAAADCGKKDPPSLQLVMYTPLFPPFRTATQANYLHNENVH